MRFWAVRRGKGLEPYGDESLAEFANLPFDKPLQVDAVQPRNSAHHRLFWALCARVGRGIGKDAEWVERAFKVETGHYDIYRYGGRENLVLRSIAFGKMDQIAFREFFEKCIEIMYRVWKIDPASVADLLVPNEDQKR
jgi:hypothetical protein